MTAQEYLDEIIHISAAFADRNCETTGQRAFAMLNGICGGAVGRSSQLLRRGHYELAHQLILLADAECKKWAAEADKHPECVEALKTFDACVNQGPREGN